MIGQRTQTAGAILLFEKQAMLPLAREGFDLAEVSFPMVDSKGCVTVRTNQYSNGIEAGDQRGSEAAVSLHRSLARR